MTDGVAVNHLALLRVAYRWMLQGIGPFGVLLMVVTGCSSTGKSTPPASSDTVPRPVSFVARGPERVDLLQWTASGRQVSGFVDSRWISLADAVDVQSRLVNFHGTLQGTHLAAIPDDGSGTWSGVVDTSHLMLQWTSGRTRTTTTFLAARIGDFDTAVQVLGDQAAEASTRIVDAKAAAVAAVKTRATKVAQALKAAAHAAAVARAEAGRLSAQKAAAHRQHPHK